MNMLRRIVLDMNVHVMHHGGMKTLQQHMTETGMKDAQLAELVGCDRSMIARIRLGYATPSLKVAVAIREHTGVDMETMLASKTEAAG